VNQFENVPAELKALPVWCVWKFVPNTTGGKPKKVPYNAKTGGKAQSSNPAAFTDFKTALAVVDDYNGLGIGVFGDIAAIDIDGCVDGSEINELAQTIIDIMDSPTEISPSGTGIRILCKASGFIHEKNRYYINNRKIGLEVYVANQTHKFLTITGKTIRRGELAERGEQLQIILNSYMLRPESSDISSIETCSCLTDEQIIEKAVKAKNGDKFRKLWEGDWQGDYQSQSEADMALAGALAYWCGRDYEQMERLFLRSALGQREKSSEREDYVRRTLYTAITNCKVTYNPDYHKTSAEDDFGVFRDRHSLIKPATEVISCKVPWLIEGFLIRGALASLQGLPDSGKSWLSCALAVAVANGDEFPQADGTMIKLSPGNVLFANFDDALEFGVKPRLEQLGLTAEGAERVLFLDPINSAGITFDDKRLAAVFAECNPDLAIFDTLQHFLGGKVDLHRANETTSALLQIKLLAEQYNTSVVIVQHISKNSATGNGGASVLWGLGSTAINGLFRSVWTIGRVKGDDETLRAAVSSKNNLLPYVPAALKYTLSQADGFQWKGASHEIAARDLIQGDSKKSKGRPSEQRDEAVAFIERMLSYDGQPVKSTDIYKAAKLEGLSESTVKRAKADMDVIVYREDGKWHWKLTKSVNIL
jgi:putative DNA primase/helicase